MVTRRKAEERLSRATLRTRARAMRHEPTDAEKKFWWAVRDRRLGGYKFKRQLPLGRYIADFACIEEKLIVELDGSQHAERRAYDCERDAFLVALGFRVARFWNNEMLENPDGIAETVLHLLRSGEPPHPCPLPLKKGERG